MPDERYREKIKKVIAMIEGAKTEGEAQAASLALQRLVARGGLTMDEVGAIGRAPEGAVAEIKVRLGSSGLPWKRSLAGVVAENYRCELYIRKLGSKAWAVFVGLDEDADVASECFKATLNAAKRCFRRYSDSYRKGHGVTGNATTGFKNSYYLGFCNGIGAAYKEQKASDESLAIVLQVPAIVKAAYDSIDLKTPRATRVTVCGDQKVREVGYRDGYSMGTQRRIA